MFAQVLAAGTPHAPTHVQNVLGAHITVWHVAATVRTDDAQNGFV